MIVSYRQRPEGKGKKLVRPYTRHLAICGAANVIGGQPLRTWPGTPAPAAAGSGFLQVCYSGDKARKQSYDGNQADPSQLCRVEIDQSRGCAAAAGISVLGSRF